MPLNELETRSARHGERRTLIKIETLLAKLERKGHKKLTKIDDLLLDEKFTKVIEAKYENKPVRVEVIFRATTRIMSEGEK